MRKIAQILALPLFLTICFPMHPSQASTLLESATWNRRLIIVYAETSDTSAKQTAAWVLDNACKLSERDLDVYLLDAQSGLSLTATDTVIDQASLRQLREKRRYPLADFEALLIGKDGGVKNHTVALSALDDFLDQIDTMPMRRAEATAQKNSC